MERRLKIALFVLIILLIAIVSFVGVYSKGLFSYESVLPDYILSAELTGKRISYFTLDDSSEDKIYDEDGNEVEEIPEDATEGNYTISSVKVNPDESLTVENFEKVKKIFEGRLKELGVEYYSVRLDSENGDIVVELEDNIITDTLLQYLLANGDFSMIDSEDETVLLDKSDIKKASVVYGSSDTGAVVVYLDIKFTSEGAKKLEEVSRNYLEIEETEETDESDESEDEDTVDEETTTDDESEEEEQKQVTMIIEGTEFLTSYFEDVITTGELTIAIGSSTDETTIYEYATQAQVYAMLLNNDEMPLTYNIESTEYISNVLGTNTIYILSGILSAIALIMIVYMIIRFRLDGLVCSISFISAIAMLLLLIRYTSTTVSIGGIFAMLALMIFDFYFMIKILKDIKENSSSENVVFTTYGAYIQKIDLILVLLIIAVVFTFMPEVQVFSIGMTLFYGILSLIISNLVFMRLMLIARHRD